LRHLSHDTRPCAHCSRPGASPFGISGSGSFDPDSSASNALSYAWTLSGTSCFATGEADPAPGVCPTGVTTCTASTLALPAIARPAGRCTVTLVIASTTAGDLRTASASTWFEVTEPTVNPPPRVAVWSTTSLPALALAPAASALPVVIASRPASFAGLATVNAAAAGATALTYAWSVESGDLNLTAPGVVAWDGEASELLTRRTLTLAKDTMIAGEYTLRLTARDATGAEGYALLSLWQPGTHARARVQVYGC